MANIMEQLDNGDFGGGRRILVYFLLDTSGSMCGAPIQAVQEGLEFLVRELKSRPEAVEMAHLSAITFSGSAQVVHRLASLSEFNAPTLSCGGTTNMTQALQLLESEFDRDFRPNKGGEVLGDYKPLVFLLTDGAPNNRQKAISAGQALKNRPSGRTIGTFLALGCGSHADGAFLKQVASAVAMMPNMIPENIRQYFRWVTASIASASVSASCAAGGAQDFQVDPPPIPNQDDGEPVFRFTFD